LLRIGGQIADALDRAHRERIIHRDLKPGNVMLTKTVAKLLDFGLARETAAGLAGGNPRTVGGLTSPFNSSDTLTAAGTILGTFAYLAPEQRAGQGADARRDPWALRCVLYETASGRRAFEGTSQAALIGAIMHTEPAPLSQLAPMTPPELQRVVCACLAKDPDERIQAVHAGTRHPPPYLHRYWLDCARRPRSRAPGGFLRAPRSPSAASGLRRGADTPPREAYRRRGAERRHYPLSRKLRTN
jgi:serine/threonine protein kinase